MGLIYRVSILGICEKLNSKFSIFFKKNSHITPPPHCAIFEKIKVVLFGDTQLRLFVFWLKQWKNA